MNHHIEYSPQSVARLNATEVSQPATIPSIFYRQPKSATSKRDISRVNAYWRRLCHSTLKKLEQGSITIEDRLGRQEFGVADHELNSTLTIDNEKAYRMIALGGSNGAAQAYIDGYWSADDLTALIRILVRNRAVLEGVDGGASRLAQALLRVWNSTRRNTRLGSRKNIAAHYDLGNDFFRLFLDKKMMYSSALYQRGDDLEAASQRKLERICVALSINADDHIVEIGCGWGGFACYAARNRGCRVTTITISEEQYREVRAQVASANLDELVEVRLQDYRDLNGQFDKLVSIEMIEAVGHQYLSTYFAQLNQLLKPGGKALIQSIVIDDARYERALKEVDFIKRYIFPGGFLPSYSAMASIAGKNHLMLEDLFDMGLSYAQTLRDWRKRYYRAIDAVASQGYELAFQRMWDFYLSYCEGAFDERAISVGQLLFRKQPN